MSFIVKNPNIDFTFFIYHLVQLFKYNKLKATVLKYLII